MIKNIQIKNYAIIDQLEIDFSKGLTIITGETGAGKSILLGALGLIMGKRADTKVLYETDKKCVIEAHFEVAKYNLHRFFEENDIDYEDECVVRRELTPSGKSRAFVNDTPVRLGVLRQLSGALIDLHQQFDTLDIHNVSFQLRMLDALAGNGELLENYQNLYRKYTKDKKRLAALIEQNDNAAKEMDFLNFQLEEFNEAALENGEQESQEEELKRLSSAEDIKRILSEAYRFLSDSEQSVVGQLETVVMSVAGLKDVHPDLEKLHTRFEGIALELQDIAAEFEQIADNTEYDGERIVEIQQRLDLIYRLQNKHRVATLAELIEIQENLAQQLTAFGDLSNEIATIEATLEKQEKQLFKLAGDLSKRRKSIVSGFTQKVLELLKMLSMEHSQLKIEVNPLKELTPTGTDEVQYLFAANKGSRLQMIKDVASGGEISRLTLVTKSLVANAIPLPTLIFDEIDSGVSGDVALKMGTILRRLSNEHQVVSITHSPQIASKADAHYFVYKNHTAERTLTRVKRLNEDERVRSIAVMLSSNPPSESAMENARELLRMTEAV